MKEALSDLNAALVSSNLRREPVAETLQRLERMRKEGLITEKEYREKRARILEGL